ncbi:MAG: metallophosphoesterase [Actinomycetota bacterium]
MVATVIVVAVTIALLTSRGFSSEDARAQEPDPGPSVSATTPEPSPEASEPVTVVAAGDVACDPGDPNLRAGRGIAQECAQHRTADLVESIDPDAVFGLGDLQNDDGTFAKYREVYDDSWGRFYDITYPVIGNHEYWSGDPDGYFDYFRDRPTGARGNGWYTFRLGGWQVYALNANCAYPFFQSPSCEPGSRQWTWLRDQLHDSDATCQLAMWHEPRVSSGPHGPYGRLESLWRLLDDAGVELVLSGHDEIYERFGPIGRGGKPDPDGVRQFVVGTGGDELYEIGPPLPGSQARVEGRFGVLQLELGSDDYAWQFRSIEPDRVRDSGQDRCVA